MKIQGLPLSLLTDTWLMNFPAVKIWCAKGMIEGVIFCSPCQVSITFYPGRDIDEIVKEFQEFNYIDIEILDDTTIFIDLVKLL